MAHKIVIVEDDPQLQMMYKFKLDLEGYEVAVAANGQEGLEVIQKFMPDLVLLDLKMPIMTGDDMLEQMRATEWGAKPRVMILTNISKNEAPMKLRFLNVDRYVVKAHHTPTQVVEMVREVLA